MRLDKKASKGIAEAIANKLVKHLGEDKLSQLPYDVISSEMSEIIGDIEDQIDHFIQTKIEEKSELQSINDLFNI